MTLRRVFLSIGGANAEASFTEARCVQTKNERKRFIPEPDKFKNFAIYAWGFTIGPTITKRCPEWQAK